MGTWGVGAFENDDANDWAYDLGDTTDLDLIRSALSQVTAPTDGYLDAHLGAVALAACETLAILLGNAEGPDAYTQKVHDWAAAFAERVNATLIEQAQAVIKRVLGPESELAELWAESGDAASWRAGVEDLRARLTGS